MDYSIACSMCGKERQKETQWRCECRAPFNVILYDRFNKRKIERSDRTIWRYRHFYPYVKKERIISLGEGSTPLVKVQNHLWFKLDYLMPTGSYKDRGSSVLISGILSGMEKISGLSEDSSGNAGASIAAYCARAGLNLKVYVPKTTSGIKLTQIGSYGAHVTRVPGTREEVSERAQHAGEGFLYVGHVWHPYFKDGIRTLAYEIAEQTSWKTFDQIYVPVSAGTLILGLIEGFRHLESSNVIEKMPKMIASQTKQVSPVYHRLKNLAYQPPSRITSVADALVSTNPPLLEEMAKILREVNADCEVVEEDEIVAAHSFLARNGFYVEPSSAVAYATYLKRVKEGSVDRDEEVLIVLTGIGLKKTL
ncbi:MAG: pyridoxal-phosphate dependent enzyme [Nitrososphaeria archaeon]